MNPTLREHALLEVLPYADRPIKVGDVIHFIPPGKDNPVVHRVVQIPLQGIRTRGDNNAFDDGWFLNRTEVTGQVVTAWYGNYRKNIYGGGLGHLYSRSLKARRTIKRILIRFLHPFYYRLSKLASIASVLPENYRPKIVVYKCNNEFQYKLMLKYHVFGIYDQQQNLWTTRPPFRALLNKYKILENHCRK